MNPSYAFRDPRSLEKWARWSVYAHFVMTSLAVISGYLEYGVLTGMRDDTFESPEAMMSAAQANDLRQELVGLLQGIVFLTSGVLTLRWIHRANWNARALGANGLRYTPGWSVGWYFVPVMYFWKPFLAMKEIWQASANPVDWRLQKTPALLGWWWLCWVTVTLLGYVLYRLTTRAEEVDALIIGNVLTLLSDIGWLPLCVIFLIVMQRIQAMQVRTAATAEAAMTPSTVVAPVV